MEINDEEKEDLNEYFDDADEQYERMRDDDSDTLHERARELLNNLSKLGYYKGNNKEKLVRHLIEAILNETKLKIDFENSKNFSLKLVEVEE